MEDQAWGIACCPNGDVVVYGGSGCRSYILDSEGKYKRSLASTERDVNKRIGYIRDIAASSEGYILLVNGPKWVCVFGLDYKYLHCFDTLTPDD